MNKKYDFLAGTTLLVDKPLEWTSFDVVNKIRGALRATLNIKKIKVGHAGTLDPLATGLLIICTGKSTKTIDNIQALYKEYTGTIKLGATTPSYDAETEEDSSFSLDGLTEDKIKANCAQFIGPIAQFPPMFSAIKVNGQPLYKKARKGEKVEVKARNITIHNFDLTRIELPEVDFRAKCSKGTYIRSLAHDFGKTLDNGGYLKALRRTKIGEHCIEDAWQLPDLIKHIEENYEAIPKG